MPARWARAAGTLRPRKPRPVTVELLREMLAVADAVVLEHGERYLPICERIEAEIAMRSGKADALARAQARALARAGAAA